MSVSDPVADMLTKIRNAAAAGHEKVDVPSSKLKLEIVKILKTEGFIKNFKRLNEAGASTIRMFLKYDDNELPVIHGIEKVSTPGRRVYSGYKMLPRVYTGTVLLFFQLRWALSPASTQAKSRSAASLSAKFGRRRVCQELENFR